MSGLSGSKRYRAVFFDLDGTLCPMEIDEFLGSYFKDVAAFAADRGFDPQAFGPAFMAGARAMGHRSPGGKTNRELFWGTFCPLMAASDADQGKSPAEWEALLDEYYETRFGLIGKDVVPNPAARRALAALSAKGYPLVLATQPMFPPRAVLWRLAWSGCEGVPFARMTTYDISTTVKPQRDYYAELLAACGLSADEVLMVGNNTLDDGVAASLGIDVFIVCDHLLDPEGAGADAFAHDTMEGFAAWVEGLPACENPASDIQAGRVL